MKQRIYSVIGLWILITVCVVIAKTTGIDPPVINIIGAYASSILVAAVLYKAPQHFFVLALCFDLLAAAFGSVLDLYRSIDGFDRFVHYLSGILAAEGGRLIMRYILKRYHENRLLLVQILFALFFSCACAAIWEIYEFSADQLIGTNMQGNNLNTMGDIVSGVLGALTYTAGFFVWLIRGKKKER